MRHFVVIMLAVASAIMFNIAMAQDVINHGDTLDAHVTAACEGSAEPVSFAVSFEQQDQPATEVDMRLTNTQPTNAVFKLSHDSITSPYGGGVKAYEPPHAPDFNFIKSRTNPAVKPYKFLDDQTWVGVPVFFAGLIAKGEKTAFRQNYNNPNTKIRLIKTNFHNEIDNYTQYLPLALTIIILVVN